MHLLVPGAQAKHDPGQIVLRSDRKPSCNPLPAHVKVAGPRGYLPDVWARPRDRSAVDTIIHQMIVLRYTTVRWSQNASRKRPDLA